jgi:tetratricopeptide (TPR) repeat protein
MTLSDIAAVAPSILKHRKIIFAGRFAVTWLCAVVAAVMWRVDVEFATDDSRLMVSAAILAVVGVLWFIRGVSVLPWQNRRISKIRRALDEMQYRVARSLLDRGTTGLRRLLSPRAKVEIDLLWADYHTRCKGDSVATHAALRQATGRALLPVEIRMVTVRWLQLYWMSESYGPYRKLLRKSENLIDEHSAYPTLQAWDAEIDGEYQTARDILQESVARTADNDITAARYNNLGRIALLMGNRTQAGDYYWKAADALDGDNTPHLYATVYHNLLMRLLQDGQIEAAKNVLGEYRRRVDWSNPYMALDYTNTLVEVARQMQDLPLLLDAHASVEVFIKPKLTREEFVAHMISELRTRGNDGQGFLEQVMGVRHVYPEIRSLPFAQRHAALSEIVGALKPLAESGNLGPSADLFSMCVQELSESLDDIDRERRSTPADLLSTQWHWISARLQALKYRAEIKRHWSDEFFDVLFRTLADLDAVATTAKNRHFRMHAKMMVVDEFASYEAQLGPEFPGSAWRETAEKALNQAEEIYLQYQDDLALVEFSIGLAWGYYRLKGDRERARFWIDRFEASGQSPLHYAGWWRDQYQEVKNWLS